MCKIIKKILNKIMRETNSKAPACGLVNVPTVDNTQPACESYVSTACVVADTAFPYVNIQENDNGNIIIQKLLAQFKLIGRQIYELQKLQDNFFFQVTKVELDVLIENENLQPGVLYEISGVQPFLYGGTTIWLKAVSETQLEVRGLGKFYVPKYDKAVLGYGIWLGELFTAGLVAEPTYEIDDKVIWGGKVWKNLTGDLGTQIDLFSLDVTNWEVIPFDEVDYNVEYDEIGYDIENDCIIYRKDKLNNEVSFSKDWWDIHLAIIESIIPASVLYNPIKAFQWGNEYAENKGNMANICINSIIENINVVGCYHDNYLINSSSILSNTLFESEIYSNTLNDSYIWVNTIDTGKIYNNILNSGHIDSNTMTDSSLFYNTLEVHGYISDNILTSNAEIYNNSLRNYGFIKDNVLTGGSLMTNTLIKGGIRENNLSNSCNIFNNNIEEGALIEFNILTSSGIISDNSVEQFGRIGGNTVSGGAIMSNLVDAGLLSDNVLQGTMEITGNYLKNGNIRLNILTDGYITNNSLIGGTIFQNTLTDGVIIENVMHNGYISTNTLTGASGISKNTLDNTTLTMVGGIANKLITKTHIVGLIDPLDLSLSTIIFGNYPKEVIATPNGTPKIRYIDDAGVQQIVAITA